MAIAIELHRDLHLLLIRTFGAVDLRDARDALKRIDAQCAGLTALRQLVDQRRLGDLSGLPTDSLIALGQNSSGRAWGKGGLLAFIAADPLAFGASRAYASSVIEARKDVLVTASVEEAIAWLGFKGEEAARVRTLLEAEPTQP